jgi:hypothetical protein
MSRKYTTDEFVSQAIAIHGDKYDYSYVKYDGRKNKVLIKCNLCLDIFPQSPSDHIFKKAGCPSCGGVKKSNTKEFIKKAILKHSTNKYDYSSTVYVSARDFLEIKCNDCGSIFPQGARDHLSGYGCPKCPIINNTKTTENFIKEAIQIHGSLYDYREVIYTNSSNKVKIYCKKCKNIYLQSPGLHLDGAGCPSCCATNISKVEIEWLDFLKIPLEYRNTPIKINGKTYKPDALDPITNTIYEFNGDYWHGNPAIFDPNKKNKNNKKTFGDLYRKTIERENMMINAGYKVISIWESDWRKQCQKKSV